MKERTWPNLQWEGGEMQADNGEYNNCVIYGHVYVYSPVDQYVDMPVGYDDFMKIFVNGELVFTDNDAHAGAWYGMNCAYGVHLKAGVNSVLIKIAQSGGYGWITQFAVPGSYTGFDWGNSTPVQGLGYLLNKQP